uniref:Choline monooxygenase n=1 Tax=Candidatus Kentrum sp. LFY TaxID=2126342 RepID=A0A450WT37_9GAMM|nr:MAG: choline monooxygenase [Candidatus Kentron sp. LFY]
MEIMRTLEPYCYLTKDAFTKDTEEYFKKSWVILTHESMLPNPGDTFAIKLFGVPIFVRRSSSGVIDGYINSCPHRGGPLFWEGLENRKIISCKYHAWSFGDSGNLKGISDFGCDISCFDNEETSLGRIATDVIDGFVFVNLSLDADAKYEPASDEDIFPQEAPKDTRYYGELSFEIKANWKLYLEGWLDIYHLRYLHPSLVRRVKECRITPKALYAIIDGTVDVPEGIRKRAWIWMHPCTGVAYYENGFAIELLLPISKDETQVKFLFFLQKGATPEDVENRIGILKELFPEDKLAAEHVQSTLEAGVFTTGFLSPKHEGCLDDFHRRLPDYRA